MPDVIIPRVGMEFTVRGLRWSAGWEFDCPTAIISPVYKFFEDGCSLEYAMESTLIDACVYEEWKVGNSDGWDWRGWNKQYLWNKYYRKAPGVEKLKTRIRFVLDEDGELSWEDIA